MKLGPPPSLKASEAERVAAYRDLSISNGQQTTYLRNGVPQGTSTDFVMLGNGTRVVDARDLMPLVLPDSPTAKYLGDIDARVERGRSNRPIWALVGLGLLGGGIALLAAVDGVTPAVTGVVGITFGSLILLGSAADPASAALGCADRTSAFMTYNRSLQQKLGLEHELVPPPANPSQGVPTAALYPPPRR